jgi:hypothetical protein
MPQFFILILTLLLTGCASSPQQAQYKAEYPVRQDMRKQSIYQFQTKPIKSSGARYWGSGNLAELFYVSDDQASTLEMRFNYPARSLQVSSRDPHNNILRQRTFILLDESAAKPSDSKTGYVYLTKDGQLSRKTKNCTPDMSVGCQWWNHTIFLTRQGDLAVNYESGGAVLMFLVLPLYGSNEYFEVFPKVSPVPG